MDTQTVLAVPVQKRLSFRARVIAVFPDTRGYCERKSKRMLLGDVELNGGPRVYFPSTDYQDPQPETVEIALPKNVADVVLARCVEDSDPGGYAISALVPAEPLFIQFVADVVQRDAEGISPRGNPFLYRETSLLRPRAARLA